MFYFFKNGVLSKMQVIRENKVASNSPLSIFLQCDMFFMCLGNVWITLKNRTDFLLQYIIQGTQHPHIRK
jgi:hypothetical protein